MSEKDRANTGLVFALDCVNFTHEPPYTPVNEEYHFTASTDLKQQGPSVASRYARNAPSFVEPHGPLPYSQQAVGGVCSEPDESGVHPQSYFSLRLTGILT
jgi:hypothetical protein